MPSAPASVGTQTRASIASPPVIGVTTSGFGSASEPFIDYLIKHSSVPLSRFFKKPECASPSPHAALNDQLPRVSYRHLPHELSRSALLKTAEKYYEENKTRRDLSIRVVKALILLFLLPACIVFLLRSAYLRFSAAAEYGSPVGIARSWALYFVYVLRATWQCSGSVKGTILPSRSAKFANDRAEIEAKGYEVLERVKDEMKSVKQLYLNAVHQRRNALKALSQHVAKNKSAMLSAEPMATYEKSNQNAELFERAIERLEREYQKVLDMTTAETHARINNYTSIADFAAAAYGSYSHIANVLSGVCLVGAGLTYTAIFSAVRGNIGLMCWSFSLFIAGLSIFITMQSILVWCSHLKRHPIWDPNFWESVLVVFSSVACLAVAGAIALLVVTVYSLTFNVDTVAGYHNPNAANWDAHLAFDVDPSSSAIVAFAFMTAGMLALLIIGLLFIMAFGARRVLWQRTVETGPGHRITLDDLV